jgi:hypothetical protein
MSSDPQHCRTEGSGILDENFWDPDPGSGSGIRNEKFRDLDPG